MKMYDVLKITFDNGNSVFYEPGEWADWALKDGFVIVKDEKAAWIAIYNTRNVFAVELLKKED
jgi:hypothetical protein